MKLLILLLLIFKLTGKALAEDTCVWYGQWNHHEFNQKLNYEDNNPARLLNNTKLADEFKNYCPTLADENGNFYLCCDETQINQLIDDLQLPKQLLQKCPSCWHNFREFTCQVACSPKQNQFMIVQESGHLANYTDKEVVMSVEYMLTQSFTDNLFESCYNVTNLILGNAALDLLCGPWGQANCTAENWLTYMGDTNNGFSPFPINVTFWDQDEVYRNDNTTYRPMNATTFPCSVGFGDEPACVCLDCSASCPVAGELD